MAKAGRIQHWKHGWIPVSPEARAFAAGLGPRPGSKDVGPVPNVKRGMPVVHASNANQAVGQDRADEINALVPFINVRPHYQFASQDTAAHYTGGVTMSGPDADKLITKFVFGDWAEGGVSAMVRGGTTGNGRALPGNWDRGRPEVVAQRRARMLADKLDIDSDDGIYPEWEPGLPRHGGDYTGGLVFWPKATDRVIKSLNNTYTGEPTKWQQEREAGLRNDGRGRSLSEADAFARMMRTKINARSKTGG